MISVHYYGDGPLIGAINVGLTQDLGRRCRNVETAAKQLCPVDTGRLRSSIRSVVTVDSRGPVGEIGSDVYYAGWRERGTSKMRGRHFLAQALPAAAR